MCLTIPFFIYNLKVFLNGNYKIEFLIGESDGNKKNCGSISLVFKVKFLSYITLATVSCCVFLYSFLLFIFKKYLSEYDLVKRFLDFIG